MRWTRKILGRGEIDQGGQGQQFVARAQEAQKDKHVYEKFEPKPNNAPKGGKSKTWEARRLPKDKDACFGCGEKGHMKKDCPKVVSASTPSERLKPLLGGGFVAKAFADRVWKPWFATHVSPMLN